MTATSTTTSTMSTTTTTPTPTIDLLTLLHQYESLHSSANADLKSSIWNITKARRVGGGSSGGIGKVEYSADDVREELCAQALLEWKKEEDLLASEEGSSDGNAVENKDGGGSGGRFVLHLDGMKAAQQRQRDANEISQAEQNNATIDRENDGLRRRRGNATTSLEDADENKNTNKWTSEEPTTNASIDSEEERLIRNNADPLHLFGVPPPALRVAQAKSRSAVAYYVEVANLAREIMTITNHQSAGLRNGDMGASESDEK